MQKRIMDVQQEKCEETTELDGLPIVVLTGFGPFRNFQVNSSWIAVQELAKMGIDDVKLIIKEIPVEYETVAKIIPKLWKEFKPKLVVHCGVSSLAHTLVLEQLAHNDGYRSIDVQGNLPPENCCLKCGFDCIRSKINMHQVSHDVNSSGIGVPAVVSNDAGRKNVFPDINTADMLFDGVRFSEIPIVHIRVSKNNTIMQLTDYKGKPILLRSCGMEGFKNTRKGTNVAAQATGISLSMRAIENGFRKVRICVRGLGPGRMASVKGLQMGGLEIISITDTTPTPHPGTGNRPRKARRL